MMKRLLIILILLFSQYVMSQNAILEGYATLELQSDYSNIKVKCTRVAPSIIYDSCLTNNLGYYQFNLEYGVYSIQFEKDGFINLVIPDIPIYSDTVLSNQLLESIGLIGEVDGTLGPGTFKVGGDIRVSWGNNLQILPGTILMFKDGVSFDVYGTLRAIGYEGDSIVFTRSNENESWGGINLKSGSSSSSLRYCKVEYSSGRGILIYNSSPTITNSLIQFNSYSSYTLSQAEEDGGGSGICLKQSDSKIRNCVIKNNFGTAPGIGIYCDSGSPIISNCIISRNSTNSTFHGGGVFCGIGGNLTIENCVIDGNYAGYGAGISTFGSSSLEPLVTVRNSIISNNEVEFTGTGGGIYYGENMNLDLGNSILWNNTGGNFNGPNEWYGINVTVNVNSDSIDAYGNILIDPLFVDSLNGDFRLDNYSPGIDAGSNDFVTSVIDYYCNHRIWDGNYDGDTVVDIGIFEYDSEYNPEGNAEVLGYKDPWIKIHPIPTKDILYIDYDKSITYNLFDLNGRRLIRDNSKNIDLLNFGDGVYLLQITEISGKSKTFKIIKN